MAIFEQTKPPLLLRHSAAMAQSSFWDPYPLHLGYYSVHTSAQALAAGEFRIGELGQKLKGAGDRRTASGTIPVFR